MFKLVKIMEEKAKKKPAKVVICEGWDERCIEASAEVLKEKLAKIILLGNPKDITKKAKEINADISKAEIVDFKNDKKLKEELAQKLFELRKHKGMAIEEARKLIEDENYFGCMYAYAGYADAVGGSAICPTAALMRPALQILREKDKLVSEIGVVNDVKNDRVLFMSDASLNIEPTPEERAQITLNMVECVKDFGIKPKVALLSFSTKGSGGDGPQILPIRETLKIVKEKDPNLIIDGEMQFDAAVSPFAAKRKCPDSTIKGDANALVFPNLTAANIFFHGLIQLSESKFEFNILKGVAIPVNLFGRSSQKETIRNIIVSLAMQVNAKK